MILNINLINFFKNKGGTIFSIFFLLFLNCTIVYSATIDELNEQIQKITETKKQLELEIAAYEFQLKDIGEQADTLKSSIKSLNATINKNTLDIKLAQNNINSAQLQIQELSINIDKNVDTINSNTVAVGLLMKELSMSENSSFLENLLTYKDMSEFWNQQQSIYLIQNQIREKISDTKNTKTILENNKTKAEKKRKELLNLKSTLLDRKELLDISKKEKNKLLADTKNSETVYKNMIAERKALSDAFDKELDMFESELKFAIDPNSIPQASKGILSWPIRSVYITSRFGPRWGRLHNGIDFRASIGTNIVAASGGVVKGTGDTDIVCKGASFGKWVFIEHGNGLSTIYAHLSLIKVSSGQYVNAGDIIGFSGNTGASTGPHLHFSVYVSKGVQISSYKSSVCKGAYTMPVTTLKGAYLDPLLYLPSL